MQYSQEVMEYLKALRTFRGGEGEGERGREAGREREREREEKREREREMETNRKKLLNINASTCTIIVHAYPHMLKQKNDYSILFNSKIFLPAG